MTRWKVTTQPNQKKLETENEGKDHRYIDTKSFQSKGPYVKIDIHVDREANTHTQKQQLYGVHF